MPARHLPLPCALLTCARVPTCRALLAFKELGMHMSFAAADAPTHKGVFDMASGGRLTPAHPGHPYKATVVTSKHRLEAEVLQEMRCESMVTWR